MNAEEHAHVAHLLEIHHASLPTFEVQAATYGELAVPTHIVLQLANQHVIEWRRIQWIVWR